MKEFEVGERVTLEVTETDKESNSTAHKLNKK